ncbi:MAG: hypothetical protein WA708_18150 [Acidobacteriaceae bacterium]
MTYTRSLAQAGRGSTLSIGATPTLIGEVRNAPMNRGKWKFADVTNFESGSDEEVLTTIRETGSVPMEGNRVSGDAGQVLVEAAYQSGALTAFVLTLPVTAAQSTGDSYAFSAYVEGSDFTVDVEKEIDFKISLKISGGTVFTAGTVSG